MKNKVIIAMVGFGNIGSYFYKTLLKNKKLIALKTGKIPIIKYISAKNLKKNRKTKIPKSKWVKNSLSLVYLKDVDIIIELIGGSEGMAKKLVFSALKNKKHVITANKSLIAKYGDELSKIAEKNKVNLEYEASVAGGVPIIRSIKQGLIANKISKIYGILNGTTNFILSTMEKSGKPFNDVLSKAKKLGFAESNPVSDLNGNDAADKIKILSSLAFNKKISNEKILVEGIQNINLVDIIHAKSLGYKIKLLGISEIRKNKLVQRVHPCLVVKNSYIGNIDGVLNAIIVDGFPVGRSILQGEGAGPGPTTSAIISDLCSILRENINYPFGVSSLLRKRIQNFDISNHICSSYLRIEVKDIPGVLSSITKNFAKNHISIKNLIQLPDKKNKKADIIIITHENLEKDETILKLNSCKYYLSKEVTSLINLKFSPKLVFRIDRSIDEISNIEKLLRKEKVLSSEQNCSRFGVDMFLSLARERVYSPRRVQSHGWLRGLTSARPCWRLNSSWGRSINPRSRSRGLMLLTLGGLTSRNTPAYSGVLLLK